MDERDRSAADRSNDPDHSNIVAQSALAYAFLIAFEKSRAAMARAVPCPRRSSFGASFKGYGDAMTDSNARELGLLAKLVIAIAALLIVAGIVWHGATADNFQRMWNDLTDRPSGPMAFRFILQPSMAAITAIRDGLRDARTERLPYLWTILRDPHERMARLREGLDATARIVLLGLVMDVIYQVMVFNMFYPVEALIIALLLAFLPYMLIRGLVVRVWHARASRGRVL
jgi:hypothetical protein